MSNAGLRKKRESPLGREAAMDAVPVQLTPQRTEVKHGKLYITVEFYRPRWQRFLGAASTCQRTFGLDAYGQEVYAACDGKSKVKDIVRDLAARHHISPAEAEVAVTTFLRTLMLKGIIGMTVPEEAMGEKDKTPA